jgi:trigger factor
VQLDKEIKKEKNARISIQVTVDQSSVKEARESVIQEFEKSAKLPGFRKGKVPRNLVLQHFHRDINKETMHNLLSESLGQVLDESEYNPITHPRITEMGDLEPEASFSFTAECDIMPEINVADWKSLTAPKIVYDVGDEAVDRELEQLMERFSTLVSVDREAKVGDYLVMDYQETPENGKPGEKKTEQTILLDNQDDQMVKQLTGVKKGETREIDLEQEYEDEEGNTQKHKTRLQVEVRDVKQKELPELNDDFAKDISDAETLDDLRSKIRENLKEHAAQMSERRTKDALMERIIEKSEYEIPRSMIDNEIDHLLADIVHTYRIDVEKLKENQEQYEKYRENLQPRAEKQLKYELSLGEIAKQEEIKVSDKELDEEIGQYAESQKKSLDEVKKQLDERNVTDNIRYRMRIARALDHLYQNMKYEKEQHLAYGEQEETE